MSDLKDFVIENGVLTKYVGQGGDVVIPDGVTEIAPYAFSLQKTLTSVRITEGVTLIGKNAFFMCDALNDVAIANGVEKIEENAFFGCGKIRELTIPISVQYIGQAAFGCTYLKKIIFECRIGTDKSYHIFDSNSNYNYLGQAIKKAWEPEKILLDLRKNSVNVLDTFVQKRGSLICFLENMEAGIIYEESVVKENLDFIKKQRKKMLGETLKNAALLRFMLQEKMISLDEAVELSQEIENVNEIEIKMLLLNYVDSFGSTAQGKTLAKREKKAEKEFLTDSNSEEGLKMRWNFKKNPDGTLTLNSIKQESEIVKIPEKIGDAVVTALNDRCFKDKKGIKEIMIPKTITKLGDKLFWGCSNLKKVYVDATLQEINEGPFSMCLASEIQLVSGIEEIGDKAFFGCENLDKITFPNTLKKIGIKAFTKTYLAHVVLPESLSHIGEDAFSSCRRLKFNVYNGVKYLGSEKNSYKFAYKIDKNIADAVLHKDCTCVVDGAGKGCSSLARVQFPCQFTTVSEKAFLPYTLLCFEVKSGSLSKDVESPIVWNCLNSEVAEDGRIYIIYNNVRYALKGAQATVVRQIPALLENDVKVEETITYKGKIYTVTNIENEIFGYSERLSSITLPKTISRIGKTSFFWTPGIIVIAPAGSYAEKYAKTKGITFKEDK